MLTNEQQRDLSFLRNLDKIIIPRKWTYWCHNTTFKPAEDKDPKKYSDKRCWEEIPTDSFVVRHEMSFVEKISRINEALDFHSTPSLSYGNDACALPFQIRVLQPRRKSLKDFFKTEEELRMRERWYNGLGDYRHPKIPGKEEVLVFASSQTDEVSGKKIDIIYCILARDLKLIVSDIKQELIVNRKLEYNNNIAIENNRACELDVPTVLKKDKSLTRLHDIGLTKDSITLAGYKRDYEINYKKSQKKM